MIDSSSLQRKLDAWAKSPKGQKRIQAVIEKYRKEGRETTAAGSKLDSKALLIEAAKKMISCLQAAATDARLPESVRDHFDSLDYTTPADVGNGKYIVRVYFKDDLSRPSLENDVNRPQLLDGGQGPLDNNAGYLGINNIVALFNNGAHAENFVYGWWNEHSPSGEALGRSLYSTDFAWVRSKKDREGLHFIQQAVSDFNGDYGSIYNVTATAGSDYK